MCVVGVVGFGGVVLCNVAGLGCVFKSVVVGFGGGICEGSTSLKLVWRSVRSVPMYLWAAFHILTGELLFVSIQCWDMYFLGKTSVK